MYALVHIYQPNYIWQALCNSFQTSVYQSIVFKTQRFINKVSLLTTLIRKNIRNINWRYTLQVWYYLIEFFVKIILL